MVWCVHDLVSQREELPCGQHLGEEISVVLVSANKGDTNEMILDTLAHEEVSARDMLDLLMMLRVVCDVAGGRTCGVSMSASAH